MKVVKRSRKIRPISEKIEEIEYMGQDSEDAAVPFVQEVGKKEEQESNQEHVDALNALDMQKKSWNYSDQLVEEAKMFMDGFDVPQGYSWGVLKTKQGICFWYRDPTGKHFASGNTISLVPEIDMNGVVRKVFKMLDEMEAKVDKQVEKSDLKIIS